MGHAPTIENLEDFTYQGAGAMAINPLRRRFASTSNGLLTRIYRIEDAVLSLRFSDFTDGKRALSGLGASTRRGPILGAPSRARTVRPRRDQARLFEMPSHHLEGEKMSPQEPSWSSRRATIMVSQGEPIRRDLVRFSLPGSQSRRRDPNPVVWWALRGDRRPQAKAHPPYGLDLARDRETGRPS